MKLPNTTHLRAAMALLMTICSFSAYAEERRDLTSRDSASKTPIKEPDSRDRLEITTRLVIDARTGEVTRVTKPSDTSGTSKPPTEQSTPEPAADEEPTLPFHYFNDSVNGGWKLDAYLLSQLSMGVYSQAMNEEAFRVDLNDKFVPQGIDPLTASQVLMDQYGNEVAVFIANNATIIVFRGTSEEGTQYPDVDGEVNFSDKPVYVEIGDDECWVHEGYWNTCDESLDFVLGHALDALENERPIFLTGHSQGSAKATVTAARLHYEFGVSVDGLFTYGSPMVGDKTFRTLCQSYGPNDVKLAEVTDRFVMIGDPVTTFPDKEAVGLGFIVYEHVGIIHNILPLNTAGSAFEFSYNDTDVFFIPTPSQLLRFTDGVGEHMWYDDALLEEVVDDHTYIHVKDLLIGFETVVQPPPNVD